MIASVRERLRPGDSLFSLDIGYGSVKKLLAVAAAAAGARHVELAVRLEGLSGPEDLVAQVAAALPPSCKLAVFDAVRVLCARCLLAVRAGKGAAGGRRV